LERLTKHVTQHGKIRRRSEKTIVKAIVAKGRDRNEFERKFINGLNKAGLAAQPDGTVVKSEVTAVATAEEGTTANGTVPKRQQPKRQSKAQRQSGGANKPAGGSESASTAPSLDKADAPKDANPAGAAKKATPQPGSGTRSRAQSGQRKGPQRPKSPSKK
jgi:YidC/Oxa1 family membrane protein insertase